MPLESASFIDQLVPSNPVHGDDVNQGDSHLRLIKSVLQSQFPNFTAAALASTNAAIDAVVAVWSGIVSLGSSIVTLAASLTVSNNLAVTGNTTLTGTLGVTGVAAFSGGIGYAGPLVGPVPVVVGTSTYTVGATDVSLSFTHACVVTLPTPASNAGRMLELFNTGSDHVITSASSNVVTLFNSTGGTDIMDTAGSKSVVWATLLCNGTNWVQIAGDTLGN